MLKPKLHNKNYTEFNGFYQLVLPLNFEVLIPEDDSVRLLSHILEGLNYEKLYRAYSSTGRKPAVEPKILYKVLTYAYMNNIYSSRKIETVCKRDINFMWLLGGRKAPDHSTVARFRKEFLPNAVEDLFYQLVNYLHHIDEVQFENLFVDGTKIEANANRYTFVWKKVVNKNEAKMFEKIQACIESINLEYLTNFTVTKENLISELQSVLLYLDEKREKEQIQFVHGIGKRKSKLQKYYESLQDFKERQERYVYDEEKDEYTCNNGKKLKVAGITHRKSASGYSSEITVYECEDCSECPYKAKCTKAQENKRMQVSKTFVEKRMKSYENIMSQEGILLRMNRSIQVEGAFGVLKNDYGFSRFLTRGKNSVKTEFFLLCFGYNINKLHTKIQNERCGNHLHEVKTA